MTKNKFSSSNKISRFAMGFAITIFVLAATVSPVLSNIHFASAQSGASVIINEVAWAGTAASPNHEWIELRNLSKNQVDLTGWMLQNSAKTLVIPLESKIIPANGYYLIEQDQTATSVQSDQVVPGLSFSDGGDSLELYDNTSTLMDTANNDGGKWPAGYTNQPVCSMERTNDAGGVNETDGVWTNAVQILNGPIDSNGYTICGSPKSLNSAIEMTATPAASITPSPTTSANTPTAVPTRTIVINEVAWMGTYAVTSDEWIELYNPNPFDISLNGWSIRSLTPPFFIPLQGTISGNGFFVVARYNAVFSNFTPSMVYEWDLMPDGGFPLYLKDPNLNTVDTANQTGGKWPAGDPIHACTMERGGATKPDAVGSWLTSAGGNYKYNNRDGKLICGSPGYANWAYSVTPTRTATPTLTPVKTSTPTPTPTGYRPASVILNEFLIQPTQDYNNDGEINSGDAFIEIVNVGQNRVLLNGWRLDDQPFDSPPYYIEDVWIEGNGGKAVFFAKDTGILLSVGTDSVRLFKSDSSLNDAKTYTVDPERGLSWCRHPDGFGEWKSTCIPSPEHDNNYDETKVESNLPENKCDYRNLFDPTARQTCVKEYEWSFDFSTSLFGDPIVVRLGPYRLLIK